VLDEFEVRVAAQADDIVETARNQIVDSYNIESIVQQSST
jgi:hypothetical protein